MDTYPPSLMRWRPIFLKPHSVSNMNRSIYKHFCKTLLKKDKILASVQLNGKMYDLTRLCDTISAYTLRVKRCAGHGGLRVDCLRSTCEHCVY